MPAETEIFPKLCPYCRATLAADAYFCPNCGKALKNKPPATSLSRQIVVYFVSLFIPPFGLWYAWKYLRQKDAKSRRIGGVAIFLTIVSVVITIWLTNSLINSVTQSLNSQLNGLNF